MRIYLAACLVILSGVVFAGSWPSKADLDGWATSRADRYNSTTSLVATCGRIDEIASPQSGTIWVLGRWSCEGEHLEAIAESIGASFHQRFPNAGYVSVHVWEGKKKLATYRGSE